MNRLILTSYLDTRSGRKCKELFCNDYEFRHTFDTFNDLNFENVEILNFSVVGDSYTEKQKCLRGLAISFQEMEQRQTDIDLSILEISKITEWLEKKAKRFGLYNEFVENAII